MTYFLLPTFGREGPVDLILVASCTVDRAFRFAKVMAGDDLQFRAFLVLTL
jgi:hypothetical protein